jgi:hypothetical protein
MWETASKFWAERGRFVAAVKTRQQGKSSTIVSPAGRFTILSIQQQERKWTLNAEKYLSQKHGGVLKYAMAEKLDGVTPLCRKLLSRLVPELAQQFDQHVGGVALQALAAWPVASGYSKSSITLGFTQNGEFELVGTVGNGAPYVMFIKGSPFTKEIRAPMRAAASKIAADMRIGG